MAGITESMLEDTCLDWLEELGWRRIYGSDIAPDTPSTERSSYSEVILKARLRSALARINPEVPHAGLDQAVKTLSVTNSPNLIVNNRNFHHCLTDGIDVEVASAEEYGGVKHLKAYTYLVDVLQRVGLHPASQVEELMTPGVWKTKFADNF